MLQLAFRASVLLFVAVTLAGFAVGPFGHVVVSGHSMQPALHPGDLVLTLERRSYEPGDVVTARVPAGPEGGSVVIHRVVGGSATRGYILRGDSREHADPWRPTVHDVQGAQLLRIPFVGLAPAYLRTPLGLALLAGAFAAAIALGAVPEKRPRHRLPTLPPRNADHGWPLSSAPWSPTPH